jgi:hypothetical protein
MQAGRYEAFAYDDRDPTTPRFFMTEDQGNGPTRRYTPDPESVDWDDNPWDMLHGNGTLEYLVLTPDGTNPDIGIYEWISNVHQARENAIITYPSTEGIDRKDNLLYIVAKNIKMLYILDLDSNTYIRISTASGLFDGHPDQVMHLVNDTGAIVYFNEDGGQDSGSAAGIHGRNAAGQYFTILEGSDWSLETTGIALSPSGHHLYVAFQVCKNGYDAEWSYAPTLWALELCAKGSLLYMHGLELCFKNAALFFEPCCLVKIACYSIAKTFSPLLMLS